MKPPFNLKQFGRENRFVTLLLGLVCLMILPPHWEGDMQRWLTGVLLSIIVFAFILTIIRHKLVAKVSIILAMPVLVNHWQMAVNHESDPNMALMVLSAFFYAFTAAHLLRYVTHHHQVDRNILAASFCVYMLIGVVWAYIYAAIDVAEPGSILPVYQVSYYEMFPNYLYFSFVTMTTVGYGDIIPKTHIAQSWVMMQTMFGQFYLAVVVARLVSNFRH